MSFAADATVSVAVAIRLMEVLLRFVASRTAVLKRKLGGKGVDDVHGRYRIVVQSLHGAPL